ncbi:MAG: hypothetical protein AB4042_08015 [Leptolyngbyaceae cyanobacterium]
MSVGENPNLSSDPRFLQETGDLAGSQLIYYFGIKQGVGAESLSEFLRLTGLDSHVATSPSALRTFKTRLVELIDQYGTQQRERQNHTLEK